MQPLKKVRCHLCLQRAVTVSGLLSPYQQRGAWGDRGREKRIWDRDTETERGQRLAGGGVSLGKDEWAL